MKVLKFLAVLITLFMGLVVFQPQAVADTGTLSLYGTQTQAPFGVYTSPYQMDFTDTSTPATLPSGVFNLICDTYNNEISSGEPAWDVSTTSLASLTNTSGVLFTGAPVLDYVAAGYLAKELLKEYKSGGSDTATVDLSYAIWQIFAPPEPTAAPGGAVYPANLDQTTVTADIANAEEWAAGASAAQIAGLDVTIYTPNPPSSNGYGVAQEFIGVPEASASTFLAFNLLALAGLFLLGQRLVRAAK